MTNHRKKLIEVALPLDDINRESAREKSIRKGHPSTLHLWWARRPLAACRAVLFAQLVDDPSAVPDEYITKEEQDAQREKLFSIVRNLVSWENANDERVLHQARTEIARSISRTSPEARANFSEGMSPPETLNFMRAHGPLVADPFAGGGSIPTEAQRLGLRAHASDLNPVAVLINKASIEIPRRLAGYKPAHLRKVALESLSASVNGPPKARNLAADVEFYGKLMRDELVEEMRAIYPQIELPASEGGGLANVMAWLWARTVPCPNPACGITVPLVNSFEICKRKGQETHVRYEIHSGSDVRFSVHAGMEDVPAPTVGKGGARCPACQTSIPLKYLKKIGVTAGLGQQLLAIVAEGQRKRVYLSPNDEHARAAEVPIPRHVPDTDFPRQALGFRVQAYGLKKHRDLFTRRQMTAISSFMDYGARLVRHVEEDLRFQRDKGMANRVPDHLVSEYARYVAALVLLGVSRRIDRWANTSIWNATGAKMESAIRLNALQMTWTFAEANPFSSSTGNVIDGIRLTAEAVANMPAYGSGIATQANATESDPSLERFVLCTDPPYFDNVPYADLSDLFYVWQRIGLAEFFPDLFTTILVPKAQELVADPYRHGGKEEAGRFFVRGMSDALARFKRDARDDYPLVLFYAFKQSESTADGRFSTGWQTFLEGLLNQGFMVVGTWPMRTEQTGGLRNVNRNSLASSIVLVCRRREHLAPISTRQDFVRQLKTRMPEALRQLQQGSIAPVDLAQASIGPGMAVFSSYSKILEPDGSPMTVQSALQLINKTLDEVLSDQQSNSDPGTRWATAWFEQHGYRPARYGLAETLATAKGTSIDMLARSRLVEAHGGNVRLLPLGDLSPNYEPGEHEHLAVWAAVHYLVRALDEGGETQVSALHRRLGGLAEEAKDLAYWIYETCEQKGWSADAQPFNALIASWPEICRLSQHQTPQKLELL